MKVYMIRHGQSESNAKNIHGGWDPSHLTEQGRADAAVAGKRLEGISFDKVYTSDLNRAMETQGIALPHANAERCELLREIDVGSIMGVSPADCFIKYGESYLFNCNALDFSDYGGESNEAFRQRIASFLQILEDQPYQNVAVFSHAGLIRTVLDVITGLFIVNKVEAFGCGNCTVCVFEYNGKRWSLDTWNFRGEIQK